MIVVESGSQMLRFKHPLMCHEIRKIGSRSSSKLEIPNSDLVSAVPHPPLAAAAAAAAAA